MTTIILAIVIGGAFGFVLDRVGATNPDYIIGMLRLGRMHLMKTIMLAIGVSSVLMFAAIMTGLMDPGHMSVKAAYVGVFIGGALLGTGFAVVGFCPGTGLAASATGRKDAMFYVLGGLLGAGAYMLSYAWVKSTGVLDSVLGGKATIGKIEGTSYPALFEGVSGEWVGLVLGVVFIIIAFVVPARIRGEQAGHSASASKAGE